MGRTKSAGERLKQYRKERGITQDELADTLDVTTGWISKLERDHQDPGGALAAEIERLTGIPAGSWYEPKRKDEAA